MPHADTTPLVEIRDLRVAFNGAEVVHGINLNIRRGECLALVGESGSGKSVTAHSILRLLPGKSVSTTGTIHYNGLDLVHASDKQLRSLRGNRIAMIFHCTPWKSRSAKSSPCTRASKAARPAAEPWNCWNWWVFTTRCCASRRTRINCRAVNGNG
jgi:ABC-type oligopeptide transport system ATPase subunit